MAIDLRTYLDELESKSPDDLLRVGEPLSTRFEITALQVALEKQGRFPVLVCAAPQGDDGGTCSFPVVTNVLASRERCADVLGIGSTEVAMRFTERSARQGELIDVDPDAAPVHAVHYVGSEVDLERFPVLWHHEFDVGPYITAGMVTTTDPDSGEGNIALQRCWVKGPAEMGVYPADGSDNWRNIMKWWERGEDAPIAVWVGHHPGVYLGGQSYHRIPYPKDHYPYISGLLGEPLRVTATRQFGQRLRVPADAEVVIEGIVPRGVYRAEGPFGERPGYTGGQRPSPVIKVQSVSHRQDAIWQDILVGHADNIVPAQFSIESLVYSRVRAVVPEVRNVRVATGFRDEVYVQIQKIRAGAGREAGIAALGTTAKFVFVFDEDVDIFDDAEVRWAIGTRSQWDRDLVVVSGVPTIALDPSVPGEPGIGSKAMVDCTMPPPAAIGLPPFYPPRNQVPQAAMEAISPVMAKLPQISR